MKQYLYRTFETDDDLSPLDWGALQAENTEQAKALITGRLQEVIPPLLPLEVRLIELDALPQTIPGVFASSAPFHDFTVNP